MARMSVNILANALPSVLLIAGLIMVFVPMLGEPPVLPSEPLSPVVIAGIVVGSVGLLGLLMQAGKVRKYRKRRALRRRR